MAKEAIILLKHYIDIFLASFSGPQKGHEALVLVGSVIMLIMGIVHLFRRKYRFTGIFMMLDALLYAFLFCLSLNIELDKTFMAIACIIALGANILNWLFGCGVSFKSLLKGVGCLILILVLGSSLLGVIAEIVQAFLPKDIPCVWQFWVLILLFVLELAAFIGAHILKSDPAGPSSSSHDDDPLKWITEDTQIVDTASMSSGANSSDGGSGDVW